MVGCRMESGQNGVLETIVAIVITDVYYRFLFENFGGSWNKRGAGRRAKHPDTQRQTPNRTHVPPRSTARK